MHDSINESLHSPVRILLSWLMYFFLSLITFPFPFLKFFWCMWHVCVALPCEFRLRRGVWAFILSIAVIGLSRRLMNLMRKTNWSHKHIKISSHRRTFFHSYFIKAIEHFFYGFIGAIDHFTVVSSVAWPLHGSDAKGDPALIQTFLLSSCKPT